MVTLVVVAVILIIIMLVFIFVLFKNIIKNINENAKKYFINKLQDYDYLLEEKQKKLEETKQQLEELAQHKNILEKKEEFYGDMDDIDDRKTRERKLNQPQIELKNPYYRETQFFNNYKQVKKIFTIDNENIIKDFIKEHKNDKENKEYQKLKKIREKFDDNTIYSFLTLESEDQIDILSQILTDTEKKVIQFSDITENKENFNIENLISYIEEKMEQIDPTIYIYTNGLDKKYDLIDKNIVMKQYNNMSEGIIIKYRNKIYDYSI